MAGELTFFELGVEDAERGRTFYSGLFGWRMEASPSGRGFTISTPGIPGGLHDGDAKASPYVFFAVEDDHAEDDEESVSRFGRFKFCRDDQGSPFGLHQPPAGG